MYNTTSALLPSPSRKLACAVESGMSSRLLICRHSHWTHRYPLSYGTPFSSNHYISRCPPAPGGERRAIQRFRLFSRIPCIHPWRIPPIPSFIIYPPPLNFLRISLISSSEGKLIAPTGKAERTRYTPAHSCRGLPPQDGVGHRLPICRLHFCRN